MGYLNDVEAQLRVLITKGDTDAAIKLALDKIYESYQNGFKFGTSADPKDVQRAKRFGDKIKSKK